MGAACWYLVEPGRAAARVEAGGEGEGGGSGVAVRPGSQDAVPELLIPVAPALPVPMLPHPAWRKQSHGQACKHPVYYSLPLDSERDSETRYDTVSLLVLAGAFS